MSAANDTDENATESKIPSIRVVTTRSIFRTLRVEREHRVLINPMVTSSLSALAEMVSHHPMIFY
jgi:hypothetical protein